MTAPADAPSSRWLTGLGVLACLLTGCGSSMNSSHTSGNPSPAPTQSPPSIDVVTYHYDNMRSGANTSETLLSPSNVNSSQFGKIGTFVVDGKVDAQPLYLSNVSFPGGAPRNVLYVVTEHGSVFAFDADSVSANSGTPLWMTSTQLAGEVPSDDRGCGQVTPEIGITSTPVIDRGRGAIYVVAVSKDAMGNYFHRLHALDLTTGKELSGGPTTITATYPGNGSGSSQGTLAFNPAQYNERPGLLEISGTIYTTWGSHCDAGEYTSWVIAYSADTLQQTSVLNLVPNGSEGGIWMAGTAPAADAAGNIYLINGNGTFDTALNASGFPASQDCGNCFAKLSSGSLQLADYFTPSNTAGLSGEDADLGSGGPLLLPDLVDATGMTRHLAVFSGKENSNIYVLDRDNLGKFNSNGNDIYQLLPGAISSVGEFGKPSYFNNTVYYGAVGDFLKAFSISNGKLSATPSSQSLNQFSYPGTTPCISANGSTGGIVWAVENGNTAAVLHAYDATALGSELYNSNQAASGRDQFADNKFITPMVANGRVYVGTPNGVAVFGLLQ
jgi:hypothetical protein